MAALRRLEQRLADLAAQPAFFRPDELRLGGLDSVVQPVRHWLARVHRRLSAQRLVSAAVLTPARWLLLLLPAQAGKVDLPH